MLDINLIRMDGGTQSRVQLDWIATSEYAQAMKEGAQFPPVVVFHDGADYWLADGFHRIKAAEQAGVTEFPADVRQGTRRDAILYSVGANANHGVRRTNADKRAAVLLLLNDEEWQGWSDREIARRCAVSHDTVWRLRESLSICQNLTDTQRKAQRNGTTYTINTENIGKRTVVPLSQPEPQPLPAWAEEDEEEEDINWAAGAISLNRDWSDEELAAYERANTVYVEEPTPAPEPEYEPELPRSTKIAIINTDAQNIHALGIAPVHLVVTSPPYNVGIGYDIADDELLTHMELLTSIWRQCYEVMEDGARIAVVVPFGVGRNPWVPVASRVMDSLVSVGFTLRGQIIWDKNTSGNRTSWGSFRLSSDPSLRDTTEAVVVAHKGPSRLELPASVKQTDEKGTHTAPLADSDYFMELAQDHWVVAPESAQRVKHPAPFPVELVRRLIDFYAFPGAHILDPFAGSGTTGVAAKAAGCDATLIELSAEYCRLAEERLNDY